jgi:ketosteroid isomerase-like protein
MKSLIDAFYAGVRQRDTAALAQLVTSDFELNWQGSNDIPWAGRWSGVQGLMQFFVRLNEHVEIVTMEPMHALADGQIAIVILRGAWRVAGGPALVEATAANVFTFAQGRISKYMVLNDTALFARALGESST